MAWKRLTQEEYLSKAREVHGDKYDYSKTQYVRWNKHVTITCPIHGDFEQKAFRHTSGKGCKFCGNLSQRDTLEDFVNKAKEVHGDYFTYPDQDYVNNKHNVTIVCPKHGPFQQKVSNHLNGYGCTKCSYRSNTEEFTRKAVRVHGDKYDYSKVDYATIYDKVEMRCVIHGPFFQAPNSHLSGSGCPSCSKSGYDGSKTGYVYILISECGKYVKYGLSNKPGDRIRGLRPKTPFDFSVLAVLEFNDGHVAALTEKCAHAISVSAGFSEFDGFTEWFTYNSDTINEIHLIHDNMRALK